MNKLICIAFCVSATLLLPHPNYAKKIPDQINSVQIRGYVGQRINDCIQKRVKKQDVDEIVNVFAKQDELHDMWGTEFWGKWVQGAIASYYYTHDKDLYNMIQYSVEKMIGYQLPDGYMGNYDKAHQLNGWDVWGRKYTTLGLLKWYHLSGDKKALKAACRLMDYTMSQIGEGKAHIYDCGIYKGMASISILEPLMFLYNATKAQRYLDFAQWIVKDFEREGGPQLIAKADIPVYNRFPVPGNKWWSRDNGQKAYEMMSCYVGLLELSKVINRPDYVDIVEKVVRHIMDEEINLCGSGAANECWYNGNPRQTIPAYNMMETCVSFTWMQINERLLQMTGKPVYADNIEHTFMNALMAAMKDDASQIVKYTPLEGYRVEGEHQCGLHINCCNANGPRAFAMIPRMAYSLGDNHVLSVNFYAPSKADAVVDGNEVVIEQTTTYPQSGLITLSVNPTTEKQFTLALRIPSWSKQCTVKVNGIPQNNVTPGSYHNICRTWKQGDKVELELDMRTRLTELNHMIALQRGPVTLARDSRFNDGDVDECCYIIPDEDGCVNVTPIAAPESVWMAFQLETITGAYRDNVTKRAIHLCDFASAGNNWDKKVRYRVWLPKTLYAKHEPR